MVRYYSVQILDNKEQLIHNTKIRIAVPVLSQVLFLLLVFNNFQSRASLAAESSNVSGQLSAEREGRGMERKMEWIMKRKLEKLFHQNTPIKRAAKANPA